RIPTKRSPSGRSSNIGAERPAPYCAVRMNTITASFAGGRLGAGPSETTCMPRVPHPDVRLRSTSIPNTAAAHLHLIDEPPRLDAQPSAASRGLLGRSHVAPALEDQRRVHAAKREV